MKKPKVFLIGIIITIILFIIIGVTGLFLFIFPIIGVLLFIGGFQWIKQKRIIENLPTSKIRSIAMGLVEICGEVVPAKGKILQSPFTNKDCVYYKCTVEEYRSSGKRRSWVNIDSKEEMMHFYLNDLTGGVLVDSRGAQIEITMNYDFESMHGKNPPQSIKNFLKSRGIKFEGFFGTNKTMRFREYIIAPNDKLFILGYAKDNPFIEESKAVSGTEDILIGKGEGWGSFYFISDKPEREIIKRFKFLSLFCFSIGSFIIIIGAVFIIRKYGLL